MSRESDALAEVLAAPDDDIPRMAYADVLVARADPRGEFIRVQCALANGDVEYLEKKELRERAAALLVKHERAWREDAGLPESAEVEWRRGFVDAVALTGEQFAGPIGARLFSVEPVRHGRIRINSKRVAKAVAAAPHFARLSHLTVLGTLGDDAVEALLDGPVDGLRAANFGGVLSESGLLAMTRCERLASLDRLSLSGSDLQGALVVALAEPWELRSLQTLFASRCGFDDDDLIALAFSPVLGQLHTLCVADNEYGARGVQALCESEFGASLVNVELDLCDEAAMRSLAEGKGLKSLRRVLVSGYEWKLPAPLRERLKKRYGRGLRFG